MAQNGDESQKVADLAVSLGVDPELLRQFQSDRSIGSKLISSQDA